MILEFTKNVLLSARFGGIEHGQKLKSPQITKGAVVDIKDVELSELLLTRGLAKKVVLIEPEPKETKKPDLEQKGTKETKANAN